MKLGRRVVLYLLYCTSAAQGDCIQRYIVVASASETRFVSKSHCPNGPCLFVTSHISSRTSPVESSSCSQCKWVELATSILA